MGAAVEGERPLGYLSNSTISLRRTSSRLASRTPPLSPPLAMAVVATAWIPDGSPLSLVVVARKRAANGPAAVPQRPPTGTDRPPKEEDLSFGSGGVEDRGPGGGPEAALRLH
eukprot:SM009292S24366  [mRNA]  locus=s9292:2:546:- [translate_table: standard]